MESHTGDWQLETAAPDTELRDDEHALAYRNVVQLIPVAQRQLLQEVDALVAGRVAHFDFVQFQHLELIRYASALLHPPSTLSSTQHRLVLEQADLLHGRVLALELTIADLLQAFARTGDLENLLRRTEGETPLLSRGEAESLLAEARLQLQQSQVELRIEVQAIANQLARLESSLP